MKKLFLTISLLFAVFILSAGTPTTGVFNGYYVATVTTQIGRTVVPGDFIFVTSTGDLIQILKSNQIANATVTSIKALGTLYYKAYPGTMTGNLLIGGTLNVTGTSTFSALPSFTIAAGTATLVAPFDTIGIAITGLTASCIVTCSYYASGAFVTTTFDTAASVYNKRIGWLTLAGKHGKVINYWVGKK